MMLKRMAIFVLLICIFNTFSQPYLSLSNQGINMGIIKNGFDFTIGLNFRMDAYNYHDETHYLQYNGIDTTFVSDSKSTGFDLGPQLSLGYYFGSNKLKPFIQIYSEVLFPVYSKNETDEIKGGYYKNTYLSGGLTGGMEYFLLDKLSIGSGIGPYFDYYTTEITSKQQDKSNSNSMFISFSYNFHFRYYL